MEITENDFNKYVAVQESGITNMWAVDLVCRLTGLTEEQCLEIMKNYGKYKKMYEAKQG